MKQDLKSQLDPILTLVRTSNAQQEFIYSLTVQVTDRCIDRTSEQIMSSPNEVKDGFLDMVIAFQLLEPRTMSDNPDATVGILNNPKGLPGEIEVWIKDSPVTREHAPSDGDGHGPQSDGKTIIRFQDAIHR